MTLFLYCCHPPRDLHSFPTRRSSDLWPSSFRKRLLCSSAIVRPGSSRLYTGLSLMMSKPPGLNTLHTERSEEPDRKSTRLNSSHVPTSYAVFCLKKEKKMIHLQHQIH